MCNYSMMQWKVEQTATKSLCHHLVRFKYSLLLHDSQPLLKKSFGGYQCHTAVGSKSQNKRSPILFKMPFFPPCAKNHPPYSYLIHNKLLDAKAACGTYQQNLSQAAGKDRNSKKLLIFIWGGILSNLTLTCITFCLKTLRGFFFLAFSGTKWGCKTHRQNLA